MEKWQADGLALSLSQSWPRSQVAPDVWEAELIELDLARAEETVRRLRRTADHAPSVAQFYAVYNGLLGSAKSGTSEPDCHDCHDTGWITCHHHPAHHGHFDGRETLRSEMRDDASGCDCNVTCPCSCRAGETRRTEKRRAA